MGFLKQSKIGEKGLGQGGLNHKDLRRGGHGAPKNRGWDTSKKSSPNNDFEVKMYNETNDGDEIENYFNLRIKVYYKNPLDYWKNSHKPKLKEIASSVLSRPASSSGSERVLSYSKKILRKDRYKMDADTLSKMTVYTNNRINKSVRK